MRENLGEKLPLRKRLSGMRAGRQGWLKKLSFGDGVRLDEKRILPPVRNVVKGPPLDGKGHDAKHGKRPILWGSLYEEEVRSRNGRRQGKEWGLQMGKNTLKSSITWVKQKKRGAVCKPLGQSSREFVLSVSLRRAGKEEVATRERETLQIGKRTL